MRPAILAICVLQVQKRWPHHQARNYRTIRRSLLDKGLPASDLPRIRAFLVSLTPTLWGQIVEKITV